METNVDVERIERTMSHVFNHSNANVTDEDLKIKAVENCIEQRKDGVIFAHYICMNNDDEIIALYLYVEFEDNCVILVVDGVGTEEVANLIEIVDDCVAIKSCKFPENTIYQVDTQAVLEWVKGDNNGS